MSIEMSDIPREPAEVLKRLEKSSDEILRLAREITAAVSDTEIKEREYRSADCRLSNLRITLAKEVKINAALIAHLKPKE